MDTAKGKMSNLSMILFPIFTKLLVFEEKHSSTLIMIIFQEEALGKRATHYEELPTNPPKKRYFSDLMDRKYLHSPNRLLLLH